MVAAYTCYYIPYPLALYSIFNHRESHIAFLIFLHNWYVR